MRKVTEETFITYAVKAINKLNTLEIRATLKLTTFGAEISLYREGTEVGHISIMNGSDMPYAKDYTRDEVFTIIADRKSMKSLFEKLYEVVNGLLDNGWFTVKKEEVVEQSVQQEGRTIAVTLHPEDEEEERTITYTGVKSISFATGKAAERIEAHTDESSIDKDHEYMVIIFNDHSKTTFRRSSVVKVQGEGKLPVIDEWDEDEPTAEEPQPTPEEADREVIYIDFKPEQDYEEERPPHAAFEQLRRDSIEPPKIWSCKALKVQEILQKIYEGKTKTSGERLDAYYNHCYNLILASRIFLPECMYHYLERKLSNEMVIAGVCPAVIEEAFGYKKTRRKWYWKL